MKKEKSYANINTPLLKEIVDHKLGALALHWIFQGLLYMDATERWFKIGLDVIMCIPITKILSQWLPRALSWGLGLVLAHTLNFILNGLAAWIIYGWTATIDR